MSELRGSSSRNQMGLTLAIEALWNVIRTDLATSRSFFDAGEVAVLDGLREWSLYLDGGIYTLYLRKIGTYSHDADWEPRDEFPYIIGKTAQLISPFENGKAEFQNETTSVALSRNVKSDRSST